MFTIETARFTLFQWRCICKGIGGGGWDNRPKPIELIDILFVALNALTDIFEAVSLDSTSSRSRYECPDDVRFLSLCWCWWWWWWCFAFRWDLVNSFGVVPGSGWPPPNVGGGDSSLLDLSDLWIDLWLLWWGLSFELLWDEGSFDECFVEFVCSDDEFDVRFDNLLLDFVESEVRDFDSSDESDFDDLCSAASVFDILSCFFHLVRRFWNHILTWNEKKTHYCIYNQL